MSGFESTVAPAAALARLPAALRALPPGVWLVGGAARDLFREPPARPADWDLVAIGDGPLRAALAALAAAAGRPPIELGKRRGETCHRFPLPEGDVDLVAAGDLDGDLARRDFTLNAFALEPATGALRDPLGGRADLAARLLRMVSEANLDADPLRALRAHRLAAALGCALEPATAAALPARAGALAAMAPERIATEMDKLLASRRAAPALAAMRADGTLFGVLPELRPLDGLGQNHYHHADVLTHVIEAVQFADDPGAARALVGESFPEFDAADDLLLKWAILLHDLGKAETRTVGGDGHVHFYGHELASERITRVVAERLKFSNERTRRLARLARFHLRPLALYKHPPGAAALRRLARDLDHDLALLFALSLADKAATRGTAAAGTVEGIAALARAALAVHESEGAHLRNLPKLVDGLRACELLGITPSRQLGWALDRLMEAQIDGSVTDAAGAEEFLRGLRNRLPG